MNTMDDKHACKFKGFHDDNPEAHKYRYRYLLQPGRMLTILPTSSGISPSKRLSRDMESAPDDVPDSDLICFTHFFTCASDYNPMRPKSMFPAAKETIEAYFLLAELFANSPIAFGQESVML